MEFIELINYILDLSYSNVELDEIIGEEECQQVVDISVVLCFDVID